MEMMALGFALGASRTGLPWNRLEREAAVGVGTLAEAKGAKGDGDGGY